LDIVDNNSVMYVSQLTGGAHQLDSVTLYPGPSNIIGPYNISRTVSDNSEYMEWGYWTQTTEMPYTNGYKYWVNNSGYYIEGISTPDISALSEKWTYEGRAEGTYWTSDGGINMTGSFSADVNFGATSNQISNFSLNVADPSPEPTHYVEITGAGGSFVGGGSPHFTVGGGSWSIKGTEAGSTAGYGSFYGPNAEAMGGVWGVAAPAGETPYPQYATGVFHSISRSPAVY
jgi:hypothetical protein